MDLSGSGDGAGAAGGSGSQDAATIPHGFQLVRAYPQARPTLRKALYVAAYAHADVFATADNHRVEVFRGAARLAAADLHPRQDRHTAAAPGAVGSSSSAANNSAASPVAGLIQWIYIRKWRVTVIATTYLELKVCELGSSSPGTLGMNLDVMSLVSSVQPVISLEFSEQSDELIAAGVSHIRVWGFEKRTTPQGDVYAFTGPRLVIEDLKTEEWVYNFQTGSRLNTLNNAHEMAISCMCYFKPFKYIVTGSKDSRIKVWTHNLHLVHMLFDQGSSPVNGLQMVQSEDDRTDCAFLLAGYEDGLIRMWNIDTGHCTYSLEVGSSCLGLGWIRKDTFYHYSNEHICVWALNRFYSTFARLSAPVVLIKRVESASAPARIVAGSEEGSMFVLSPVTGSTLLLAYPPMNDMTLRDFCHDRESGMLWSLGQGGNVTVYKSSTNPSQILNEWPVSDGSIRFWRVTVVQNDSQVPGAGGTSAQCPISLKASSSKAACSTFIPKEAATDFAVSEVAQTVAVATVSCRLRMFTFDQSGFQENVKMHPADEDHTARITSISEFETGAVLFATSSEDKTNEIMIVKRSDYLPSPYSTEIENEDIEDDIVELPLAFDEQLDFWALYRKKASVVSFADGYDPDYSQVGDAFGYSTRTGAAKRHSEDLRYNPSSPSNAAEPSANRQPQKFRPLEPRRATRQLAPEPRGAGVPARRRSQAVAVKGRRERFRRASSKFGGETPGSANGADGPHGGAAGTPVEEEEEDGMLTADEAGLSGSEADLGNNDRPAPRPKYSVPWLDRHKFGSAAPTIKPKHRGPTLLERLAEAGIAVPNSIVATEVQSQRVKHARPLPVQAHGVALGPSLPDAANLDVFSRTEEEFPARKSFALPPHLRSRRRAMSEVQETPAPLKHSSAFLAALLENDDSKADELVEETPNDGFSVDLPALKSKRVVARDAWKVLKTLSNNANEASAHSDDLVVDDIHVINEFLKEKVFSNIKIKKEEFNLTNIIRKLMEKMKHGLWLEKCEASKAVLFLYMTFKEDLVDPADTVVLPQLDFLGDSDWQFRAQLCINLGSYRVYHPDVMLSLMSMLQDENDTVRHAAKHALLSFGIGSTQSLYEALLRLGVLKPTGTEEKGLAWLD
ncbi:WD repeat-containing protein 87, partial [Cladochytrium tenue]